MGTLTVLTDDVVTKDATIDDVVAQATAKGRLTVADEGRRVIAVSLDPAARRQAVEDLVAPDFTLPDLAGVQHQFSEWSGQKRLLFAWSSW